MATLTTSIAVSPAYSDKYKALFTAHEQKRTELQLANSSVNSPAVVHVLRSKRPNITAVSVAKSLEQPAIVTA